ncbi:MAG: hypothetical protein V1844_03560 [Pseudomonadota bacterium]
MRRLLKYAAIFLLVIMSGSSVWAYNYSDHISTAPNNKGDVLVFPWYLALDGGWQTKLTVINTNVTNCVVAKVVIRSFRNSEELIDFLIYLSPADVWTGAMKVVGGKVVIFSDDDSAVYSESPLVFANATNIVQPMFPLDCPDDADYMGYVEVIMAAYKPGFAVGVAKSRIFNGYKATSLADQNGIIGDPAVTIGTMIFPYTTLVGVQGNPNSLAGYMELQNATLGLSTSLRATTFKDNDTDVKLTTAIETRLGEQSRNSLGEIEATLAKNDIAMPYVNGANTALHFFTFPTKLTQRAAACKTVSVLSPFFNQNSTDLTVNSKWCVEYSAKPYDLQEHTTVGGPFSGGGSKDLMCTEVFYLSSAIYPFAEGWANYIFNAGSTATFTDSGLPLGFIFGTPVIPTYLYIGSLGLEANYGAWGDAPVYRPGAGGLIQMPAYQYTDYYVAT